MKGINFLLLFSISIFSFFACKNKETQDNTSNLDDGYYNYLYSKMDTLASIDQMIDTSNCAQYSLDFGKENKERYFATLYCNSNGEVHLMEELMTDSELLISRNKFYFAGEGKLFATVSERQEKKDSLLFFIEEINIYGTNGKVEKSFRKITSESGEGEYLPSKDNAILNNDRIMKAMKNEGEFSLTFQGIIKTDNLDYLIVGGAGENSYTSALQIEANTSFINDIYKNEINYVGKKIAINFERKVMDNFSYQVFVAGKWLD